MSKSKKITVKVTQKHILKGERLNAVACPIALALKAQRYTNVDVCGKSDNYVSSRTGVTDYHLDLPKSAETFISKFDKGLPVKPFTFTATRTLID